MKNILVNIGLYSMVNTQFICWQEKEREREREREREGMANIQNWGWSYEVT
jgi:hypothetical protein